MAANSTRLPLGTKLPAFALPNVVDGRTVCSDMLPAGPVLVMFICNHCPYVLHVRQELGRLARDYLPRGISIVAISSNSARSHPEDGPDEMRAMARNERWEFPYAFDSTQEVAKSFQAACTPEFYLFDRSRTLVYHGQLDDSRPGNGIPVTGKDLRTALNAVLEDRPISESQKPSVGCSIKWQPGNEPDYLR